MATTCLRCKQENPAGAKFCARCGSPVPPPPQPDETLSGEISSDFHRLYRGAKRCIGKAAALAYGALRVILVLSAVVILLAIIGVLIEVISRR